MQSDSAQDSINRASGEEKKLIDSQEAELRKRIAELKSDEKKIHVEKSKWDIVSMLKDKFQLRYILSFIIYLTIALIIFIPISSQIGKVIPGVGADSYQNIWGIWWVNYATFTLHTSIWYTYLFFPPIGANLIYQTMMPIGSFLSLPFQVLFGVPFAYDVLFFLGFAVSGLGMFILAEYLTKNHYAAFISGVIFSFSAFHIAQSFAHIDWIFIGWLPISLYFLLKVIRNENPLFNAVGLGISFVFTVFMGDLEQGVMFILAALVIIVAYLIYKDTRKRIINLGFFKSFGVFLVVALIVGSLGFIPIIGGLLQPNTLSTASQLNDIAHNELYSADLLSFFLPSYLDTIFHGISQNYFSIFSADPTERITYIGYVALLLAIYGVYKNFKTNKKRQMLLWIAIALIFGWLALGPYLQVDSIQTALPEIYLLYHHIPVLDVLREPGRFDLVAELAVAVLAAFGVDALFKDMKFNGNKALLVVAIITILILAEANGITGGSVTQFVTQPVQVPAVYYQIGNTPGNFSVLEVPALPVETISEPELFSGEATYYTSITHKALVGGYIGRENNSQEEYLFNVPLIVQAYNLELSGNLTYSSPVNENPMNQTILTLYNYNTGIITVPEEAFNSSDLKTLADYMIPTFGEPIQSNGTLVFVTTNAVNDNIYRSFVSYPILTDWSPTVKTIRGVQTELWAPINPGPILVYAPYPNATDINQNIQSGLAEPIDTNISFQAIATPAPTSFSVYELNQQGNTEKLAIFNISNTGSLGNYSFTTSLFSGPRVPTTLLFVVDNSTGSYVLFSNIRFRAKT